MKISVEELVDRTQELIIEYDGRNCFREDYKSNHQWYFSLGMELEQILHEKKPYFEKREIQHLIVSLYELSAAEGSLLANRRLEFLNKPKSSNKG